MEFFTGTPTSTDAMWRAECAAVARWCVGRGVDPGAGGRTFADNTVRVDCFTQRQPHVCADAGRLPFRNNVFDYCFSSHTIEHMREPTAALREWARVVKPGGYVATIVPNVTFTGGQNTDATPHYHEWTPRAFLRDVCGWDGRGQWFDARPELGDGLRVVGADEACPHWSFYVVVGRGECGQS